MEQEQIFPLIRKDGSFSENVRISPAELKVKTYFDTLEKVLGNPQKEVGLPSEDYGHMYIDGLFSIETGRLTPPYEIRGKLEANGFKNQYSVQCSSIITIFSPKLEKERQEWVASIHIQSNNSQGDMHIKIKGKDEGLKVGYMLLKEMMKKL